MIKLADENKCTGCCACLNSCSFGALQMTTDRYGFFRPYIDEKKCTACGQCERACPVLHQSVTGREKPDCYAAWAPDEIRQISSSGGIFPSWLSGYLSKVVLYMASGNMVPTSLVFLLYAWKRKLNFKLPEVLNMCKLMRVWFINK